MVSSTNILIVALSVLGSTAYYTKVVLLSFFFGFIGMMADGRSPILSLELSREAGKKRTRSPGFNMNFIKPYSQKSRIENRKL